MNQYQPVSKGVSPFPYQQPYIQNVQPLRTVPIQSFHPQYPLQQGYSYPQQPNSSPTPSPYPQQFQPYIQSQPQQFVTSNQQRPLNQVQIQPLVTQIQPVTSNVQPGSLITPISSQPIISITPTSQVIAVPLSMQTPGQINQIPSSQPSQVLSQPLSTSVLQPTSSSPSALTLSSFQNVSPTLPTPSLSPVNSSQPLYTPNLSSSSTPALIPRSTSRPPSPSPGSSSNISLSVSADTISDSKEQKDIKTNFINDPPPSNVSPSTPSSSSSSSSSSASSATASSSSFTLVTLPPIPQIPVPEIKELKPEIKELSPIKLANTTQERTMYENLSDLFAIIVTIEHLETAYVRDAVEAQQYTKACNQLLAQFKTCKETVKDYIEIEKFMQEYGMECRAALNRINQGVPATVIHGANTAQSGESLIIFHAVQHFITTMDSLKLNLKAVDEIHPHLTDLMESINKVSSLPAEHESKVKVKDWLLKLNVMRAHEELSDEQVRQMSFDLETAYNCFHKFVQENDQQKT